jgi:hypothetical protein
VRDAAAKRPADSLLFLSALGLFIALLLLGMLLLPVLLLLLLGMLLLPVLLLLLLGMLLLPVLVLPLLLLSVLWLLSMLLFELGLLVLALLLFRMVLLSAPLALLRVGRIGDSENQRQNGCAADSNSLHKGYLYYCSLLTLCSNASFLSLH